MKRMIFLEVKKLLKNKLNIILIVVGIVISLLVSLLAIKDNIIEVENENGEIIELQGKDAIDKSIELGKTFPKTITSEVIEKYFNTFYNLIDKYGSKENIPNNIYNEKILPMEQVLDKFGDLFSLEDTPYKTRKLNEINISGTKDFYKLRDEKIDETYRDYSIKDAPKIKMAESLENYVKTPFNYEFGFLRPDQIVFIVIVIILISIVISVSVFSSEYETGSDDILRSTKYGRRKLAISKTIATLITTITLFLISMISYLLIVNVNYHWKGLDNSIQMIFSVLSFIPFKTRDLLLSIIIVGTMSTVATTLLGLYISTRTKSTMTSLLKGIVIGTLPITLSFFTGNLANWIKNLIPTSGMMYIRYIMEPEFLYLGKTMIWIPFIIIAVAIISIIIFPILTIRSYTKHEQ